LYHYYFYLGMPAFKTKKSRMMSRCLFRREVVKKVPIILHLINGTFVMGGRGSEFFVSCLILKTN